MYIENRIPVKDEYILKNNKEGSILSPHMDLHKVVEVLDNGQYLLALVTSNRTLSTGYTIDSWKQWVICPSLS